MRKTIGERGLSCSVGAVIKRQAFITGGAYAEEMKTQL